MGGIWQQAQDERIPMIAPPLRVPAEAGTSCRGARCACPSEGLDLPLPRAGGDPARRVLRMAALRPACAGVRTVLRRTTSRPAATRQFILSKAAGGAHRSGAGSWGAYGTRIFGQPPSPPSVKREESETCAAAGGARRSGLGCKRAKPSGPPPPQRGARKSGITTSPSTTRSLCACRRSCAIEPPRPDPMRPASTCACHAAQAGCFLSGGLRTMVEARRGRSGLMGVLGMRGSVV